MAVHLGTVFSIDCVLPEFFRLERFVGQFDCIGLEMETAAVFSVARLVGISAAALLMVSDNPFLGKSLFSGRTEVDRERRRYVRPHALAKVVLDSLLGAQAA